MRVFSNRKLALLAFAPLVAILAALPGCPRSSGVYRSHMLIIDDFTTDPETPLEVCGMDEVAQVFIHLRCATRLPVYENASEAVRTRDPEYRVRNAKGLLVLKFLASCHRQSYELYVAPEACEAGRKPLIPFDPNAPTLKPKPLEGDAAPAEEEGENVKIKAQKLR